MERDTSENLGTIHLGYVIRIRGFGDAQLQ